ncbi:MAG: divalent metal cation transporter [Sulfolobaceae archaeon]
MSIKDISRLFGPAWIVMIANIDTASVIAAVSNGQIYGYGLVWFLVLLTVPLFIIQEACGRIGAVTGLGLGELIRSRFSGYVAILTMAPIFIADMASYIVEYIGIVLGGLLIGIPPYISLPSFFLIHIMLVIKGKYQSFEKFLILISFILFLAFLIQLIIRGIDPTQSIFYFSTDPNFLFFLATNVGAVIMPFMPIYQASATAYKYSRLDYEVKDKVKWVSIETIIGSIVSELIMIFIEMSTTGLGIKDPLNYHNISESLSIVGNFSPLVFGIGLIFSGLLSLIVISLGSSWGILEALRKNNDIKSFLAIYSIESLPAIIIIALMNYQNIVYTILEILSIYPIIVSIPAILIGYLVSDRKVMGEFAYKGPRKILYWLMTSLVLISGIISLIY